MSALEETFALQLKLIACPPPVREFRFAPPRRWRFDFAYPAIRLAVEIEGGRWIRGRHSRPKGFQADCEKYNAAARLGWTVLRFTDTHVNSWSAAYLTRDTVHALSVKEKK